MADFHEYYSGSRVAPCLTVFVGGNHEASNHLFELYYGGWVAPNIYYIGAANVLRLGPLRIAGLSGIWKGYDYRKSHFERLPYNKDDEGSIYHVRELDVRKLLSLRTQVDIGISHDWPQGVEWLGDHGYLFGRKNLFKADAEGGKLGSIAARQCLERLRPPHWFSAHLHIKYAAVVQHPDYQEMSIPGRQNRRAPAIKEGDCQQISAWGTFHAQAQKADAEDNERALREQQNLKEEELKSGMRSPPRYIFSETFKQVKTDDNLGRAVTAVTQDDRKQEDAPGVPQLDGCIESRPGSLKRRREPSNPDAINVDLSDEDDLAARTQDVGRGTMSNLNGSKASSTVVAQFPNKDPDAIDVHISSEDEKPTVSTNLHQPLPSNLDGPAASKDSLAASGINNPDSLDVDLSDNEPATNGNSIAEQSRPLAIAIPPPKSQRTADAHSGSQIHKPFSSDSDEDGGMQLNPAPSSFRPMASMASILQDEHQVTHSRTASHHSMEALDLSEVPAETEDVPDDVNTISDEMRARLAELNPSFAKEDTIETSPALPFPKGITNKTTQFLALDKCEPHREFLQLLEIEATSGELSMRENQRPLKLHYDPEWLAILRVFAPELRLGGDSNDGVPKYRGDMYYRDRIIEEESYIQKHVVEAGLIEVPENFTITAPIFDPNLPVHSRDMPREVTNPQTSGFCSMLGIDDHFDISEEERDARIAQGPRQEKPRYGGGGRRGRGGFNNRGGGRGGGRGRGRGRGGRW